MENIWFSGNKFRYKIYLWINQNFYGFSLKEFSKKFVVILDNFVIENENEQIDLENIIDYFKRITKYNYKLIVSGEGKFFNQNKKQFFSKDEKHIREETLIFIHLNAFTKFKDKNISEYKNENKFKLRFKDEEKVYLKKFSFQSLYLIFLNRFQII